MRSLSKDFGLEPLLDKTLAILPDVRLSANTDLEALAESLLSVSGADTVQVNRKNKLEVAVNLSVRFMILTNQLPALRDSSGALASRFVALKFTRSWLGEEDPTLEDRLAQELPGILNWALAGLRLLRQRGRLDQPESGLGVVQDLAEMACPIGAFVREFCDQGPGLQVDSDTLFGLWESWCEERRQAPGIPQTFGRQLGDVIPGLERGGQRRREGKQVGVYKGVGLRAAPGPEARSA
jgi:putative DNA primase/helicase